MWNGIRIVLGVCGGIAAYKAVQLASLLKKQGALVDVILTGNAQQFVSALTFQTMTGRPVYTDTFDEREPSVVSHIELADQAQLVMIAPATANLIGKYANGIADDMLTTTLLACRCPVIIAPAMNGHMWNHPAVQDNLRKLTGRGVHLIDPASGMLACGYEGKGRLPEPADLASAAYAIWQQRQSLADGRLQLQAETPAVEEDVSVSSPDWSGIRLWITAGGTREPLDPVRFLGNSSSGKMGFALAEAAAARGADVTLIAANVSLLTPPGVARRIDVVTALDMHRLIMDNLPEMDVLIKSAAVADYRPVEAAKQKIKKTDEELTVRLVKNPDILADAGHAPRADRPFLVGFAAETERLLEHAESKMKRKNCDLLIANQVSLPGAGFGSDMNRVTVLAPDGSQQSFELMDKRTLAGRLLDSMRFRIEPVLEARAAERQRKEE